MIINLILIGVAICLYTKGECDTKWLGKCNKNWKLTLGLPIGLLGLIALHTLLPLLCFFTYLIAGSMGYGENNWFTKLVGQRNAIIGCGVLLGLASFPIIGFWSLLQAIISGWAWYYIWKKDGIINEPWVAILRSASALICLI